MLTLSTIAAAPFGPLAGGPLLAYLDPGTGSFILQVLIAGLLGSMFALKQSWQWVKCQLVRGAKKDG